MLKNLKKIVAGMALITTVITQVSIAGAATVSDYNPNSGITFVDYTITDSGSSAAAAPASYATSASAPNCDVVGTCGNTGATTASNAAVNFTNYSTGTGRPNCDVLGTCGENVSSTIAATIPVGVSYTSYSTGTGRPNCDVLGTCGDNVSSTIATTTPAGVSYTNYSTGTGRPNCDVLGTCGDNVSSTTNTTNTGSTVVSFTEYSTGTGRPNCDVLGTCPENNVRHPQYPPQYPQYPNYPTARTSSKCADHYYPQDIDSHWAEIYIRRLYDLCIFDGYSDGSFRPDWNITRAEVVKTFLFAANIAPNQGCYDTDCGSPFMDLDSWQGKWLRPAWDRHIVQGYNNDNFYPNYAITRAEATKIIVSAFGYGPLNVSRSFFNDVNGWSMGWIEQAHQLGIISGIGNGNFDPDRPITRAEVAKIVAKTIEMRDTRISR